MDSWLDPQEALHAKSLCRVVDGPVVENPLARVGTHQLWHLITRYDDARNSGVKT